VLFVELPHDLENCRLEDADLFVCVGRIRELLAFLIEAILYNVSSHPQERTIPGACKNVFAFRKRLAAHFLGVVFHAAAKFSVRTDNQAIGTQETGAHGHVPLRWPPLVFVDDVALNGRPEG